jgi:hypothetical protein
MQMLRADIFKILVAERHYQQERWVENLRDPLFRYEEYADDDIGRLVLSEGPENEHEVDAFVAYVNNYANAALKATSEDGPLAALHMLRKVAALCLACFEQHGCPERDTPAIDEPKAAEKAQPCSVPPPSPSDLVRLNLSCEEWRTYSWGEYKYRIHNPVAVYFRKGGETHRVVDADGVAHCVPAPGQKGCVLTWKNKPGFDPVGF